MLLSDAPPKVVEAFAIHGAKNVIPVPSQIPITPGAASLNDGFPPLTMTPIPSGGVPMSGLDMNGVLNLATAVDWWKSAGAGWPFDSVFAAAVGGYPKGARVLNAAGTDYWFNTLDNNSTNPDTGSVPTGWIPSRNAYASVYASGSQVASGANSKVFMNTVEFDDWGMWNGGSTQFKAPWAGKYRMSGALYLFAAPAGQYYVEIWKNSALAKRGIQYPQVSNVDLTLTFDAIISLAVGDYLEPYLSVPGGSVQIGASTGNEPLVYAQLEYLGE